MNMNIHLSIFLDQIELDFMSWENGWLTNISGFIINHTTKVQFKTSLCVLLEHKLPKQSMWDLEDKEQMNLS